MKKTINRLVASLLLTAVTLASMSCGSKDQPTNTAAASNTADTNTAAPGGATIEAARFTNEELDQLLAPIALYPDPLLAQMIPAATFVDQIKEAQQHLNGKADDGLIANQDWDVSVKSIAHYPPVLKKMADDIDWTTTIGQAYISQPDDVSRSIQRLRLEASDAGNLVSTPQQKVIEKDNIIRIEPAEPKVIYVPEYNPETVYVEETPDDDGVSTGTAIAIGAIAFSAGLLIGSWLNRDYDYYGYYGPPGVYYHGWNGAGWIGVNRSYVDVDINRNVYINESYRNINVNRNIANRNVSTYRSDLTRNATIRNQRVTNARVNRQLNRQPGRDRDRGDTLDRGRGPEPGRDGDRLTRGPERNTGTERGRNRDRDSGGDRSRIGGGKDPGRGIERRDAARPNSRPKQQPRGTQRQGPSAAPRQPQRQSPSHGSPVGRRRG